MRICLILLILFNSSFLFGKSSEFGARTIAPDGDSTSVFKPQRELYFSCFSPWQIWKYNNWRYSAEIAFGKSLNKYVNVNHGLIFIGFDEGTRPFKIGGEFYEFTFSHRLKLNKKGSLFFEPAYGIFAGDFRIANVYSAPPPIYSDDELLIYFGIGTVFKAKLRYNFSDKFGVSVSSNLRTYFGWATTKDYYYNFGYEFSIYPFWQYLQVGIDIKLKSKK